MGHILILLHKIVGVKLAVVLLSVTAVAIVFPLSSAFQAHALNVHTEIKANPAGIVRIIDKAGEPPSGIVNPRGNAPTAFTTDSDGTLSGNTQQGDPGSTPPDENGSTPPNQNQSTPPPGINPLPPGIENQITGRKGGGGAPPGLLGSKGNQPTTLTINTDIDFGMVFPGETQQGEFTIYITDATGSPTVVSYHLILVTPPGKDYMTVERDPAESDASSDNVTSASLTDPGDTSDRWLVTFSLPDDPISGNYTSSITIWVDSPLP